MNKERLLELADKIEKLELIPYSGTKGEGFHMGNYVTPCGTPSCIAGWAVELFYPNGVKGFHDEWYKDGYVGMHSHKALATELLDLNSVEASDLFVPTLYNYNRITPTVAANTIRSMVNGEGINFEKHIEQKDANNG